MNSTQLPYRWTTPERLLQISVVVAIATIALKTTAGAVSGAVGLLSDALESLVNLVGALFALGMVTIAKRPADDEHPYGHTKAEYFSSGFEGLLIFGAAMAILWASVSRLLHPQPLEQIGWGMALSLISTALRSGSGPRCSTIRAKRSAEASTTSRAPA